MRWHGISPGRRRRRRVRTARARAAKARAPPGRSPSFPANKQAVASSLRGGAIARFRRLPHSSIGASCSCSAACADAVHTPEQIYLAFRHPRRKAGPQSHGTHTESRPGYRNRATTLISRTLVRGDQRDRCRGCSPVSQVVVHVQSTPLQAQQAQRRHARHRPRLRRGPGSGAGLRGRSRNRQVVRRPRRLHRHEHRAIGAQRRPRRLARHGARRLRPARPSSTAPRTPPTPSPRRRSSTSRRPTTSRPASPSRPPTTSRAPTSATGPSRPAPTASPRRPSSPARSRWMPRAIRTRSSCSRSPRR